MITLKRSDLYRFGRYANKVFGQNHHINCAWFMPTNNGAELVVTKGTAALRVHFENLRLEKPVVIPWELIKEIGSKKGEAVNIIHGEQNIIVEHSVGEIFETVNYACPKAYLPPMPELPETLIVKPADFLDMLTDCSHYTDANSVRYTLGGVCMNAETQTIAATNGRIAIRYFGHDLPWEGEMIVPYNKFLAAKEFHGNGIVSIGGDGNWFTVKSGQCTVQIKKIDGKFPLLGNIIPTEHVIATWLDLDDEDADFVMRIIDKLPNKKNGDVTLDMSGGVIAIRAADKWKEDNEIKLVNVTELVLARSSYSGEDFMVILDRDLFKQFLKSGFRRIGFQKDSKAAILASGDMVSGVTMPSPDEDTFVLRTEDMTSVSSTDQNRTSLPPRKTPVVKSEIAASPEPSQTQPIIKETPQIMNALKNTHVAAPVVTEGIVAGRKR